MIEETNPHFSDLASGVRFLWEKKILFSTWVIEEEFIKKGV
jgi:hypothetical protein